MLASYESVAVWPSILGYQVLAFSTHSAKSGPKNWRSMGPIHQWHWCSNPGRPAHQAATSGIQVASESQEFTWLLSTAASDWIHLMSMLFSVSTINISWTWFFPTPNGNQQISNASIGAANTSMSPLFLTLPMPKEIRLTQASTMAT